MTEHSTDQGGEAHDKPESASSAASDQSETTAKTGANLPAPHHAAGQDSAEPARPASNIMILWPERPEASERVAFAGDETEPRKARTSPYRRRRAAAMAAIIAVAALCGAAGGSLATFAFGHTSAPQAAAPEVKAATAEETALLRETVARLNADLNAMKSDLDRTGKTRTTQISMLGERLNKVEKTQDETASRVAKIGDAQDKVQDKLRTASAAPPAADVTGSIAAAKPKAPIVEGWTLTRVSNGAAVVDGPMGLYEAYPGDPLPGIGRVDAVRYQDGRWVVVTPKGLIVRR
ncbi:hypothetical protein [Bradyrhizobium sp. 2TAF24]|uniref:hypothetical protein n=1 Tax=Bradyrhizobium sp. 2TAF24 TaxID=3233011 RepID=UPI003F8F6436